MFNLLSHQGNANHTSLRFHLQSIRLAKTNLLSYQDLLLSRMWSKGRTHLLQVRGSSNSYSHYGNQCSGSQEAGNADTPLLSTDSPSCYRSTCSIMFFAALFNHSQKLETTRMSLDRKQIKKMWHRNTMK